ncbi:gamma-glutamylcyclotransferase [Paraburkholderia bannensis]|uniref:glutathione-specific gamma-glutamylcyclotransferase n=1 Tax=Paraburkholderia tropica TaxID=92647 RepID=A0AAQ1JSZ6_9BURK|nr:MULTISPECIES: gamma-glutamylcyclotransferase [Paraburkholderia]RQM50993.1 gamma-glutamylcyclotransferase [Paraburkholderia bannensis]RQN40276.1 gamma-glutamylcyclotransferase [Paraburkholderia tropica]SEJ32415.1 cation transport protein ChaC [Paraburkholderia tropica]
MSKLTKDFIESGAYRTALANAEEHPLWTSAELDASLQSTLKLQPERGPVWLFAYGSLLWNPLLDFVRGERGMLHGWHRSFCIRLVIGRGTAEVPGRMLALEAGGVTSGVAYQLRQDCIYEDLSVIWAREMIGGVYRPTWTRVELENGDIVHAIAFVANELHALYEEDSTVAAISSPIMKAAGPLGDNIDYVLRLEASLSQHGLHDPYISELAKAVSADECTGNSK